MTDPKRPCFPPWLLTVRCTHHSASKGQSRGAVPFVSPNEMQQQEDCKPRMQQADSRSTRSGTSQPEGPGDMFISDKPFANFWTNCSSCPGLQPRIDDGPAAVPSCTANPPTCSALAPSYDAGHRAGLNTALRAPRCRASVLRQLKF